MKLKQFGSFYWDGPTLRLNYMVDGERQRPWFAKLRTGSKAEKQNLEQQARNRLNELEVAVRRGELFDNAGYPTYEQMAKFYWEKFQSQKRYIQEDPRCYASDWSKLSFSIQFFGARSGADIKREDIKEFRMWLREHGNGDDVVRKWKNAYINRIIASVGQVYKQCITQEFWRYETATADEKVRYGKINLCVRLNTPVDGLPKLEETPKKPIVPELAQFQKLLGLLRPAFKDMAILGVHTGLRRRNVVRLKLSEIDWDRKELKIDTHKGGSPASEKKLHHEALAILLERKAYIEREQIKTEYIFCKPDGNHYIDFYTHWRKACEQAGIPGFWFEHLRPTYSSWRFEEGASIAAVQRQLDHSTAQTTTRFYNRSNNAAAQLMEKQRNVLEPVGVLASSDRILTNPDRNPDNFLTEWVPISAETFRNVHLN